jgi:hypothetical protein
MRCEYLKLERGNVKIIVPLDEIKYIFASSKELTCSLCIEKYDYEKDEPSLDLVVIKYNDYADFRFEMDSATDNKFKSNNGISVYRYEVDNDTYYQVFKLTTARYIRCDSSNMIIEYADGTNTSINGDTTDTLSNMYNAVSADFEQYLKRTW